MATAILMSNPTPTDEKWTSIYLGWPRYIQKREYGIIRDMYDVYMIDL